MIPRRPVPLTSMACMFMTTLIILVWNQPGLKWWPQLFVLPAPKYLAIQGRTRHSRFQQGVLPSQLKPGARAAAVLHRVTRILMLLRAAAAGTPRAH